MSGFSAMMHRLGGQPDSYDRKAQYKFGRTLGAGTYGIVREAIGPQGKCAIKIILKRNVKGNEQMVQDEIRMLLKVQHPHIVKCHDAFESKDKWYIVTELATGGEMFDRICEKGKFTEKDAADTIRQVLEAIEYLHELNIVHRDLKPENLLYLTSDPASQVVLADFGIAKELRPNEVLTTMAGSFGYAAPEIMERRGHGKAVDLWSLGVITYTLLCGYPPFRSEGIADLIEETRNEKVIFHTKYWKGVSEDAKNFVSSLLKADPRSRPTAKQALEHPWIGGMTASDHNLLPEIRKYMARARLRRGIEIVKLTQRIEALRSQETDAEDDSVPNDAAEAAGEALAARNYSKGVGEAKQPMGSTGKKSLSKIARGAIFREVVLAAVRQEKEKTAQKELEHEVTHSHSH